MTRIKLPHKTLFTFLGALLFFGALIRLSGMYHIQHYFDLNYYYDWAMGLKDGIFTAYNNIKNLDYPPVYLFFLLLPSKLMSVEWIRASEPYMMLILKLWPVLFDLATGALVFFLFYRRSHITALAGCFLWTFNPAMIYNSSYWGQTDSIMMFFLLLSFWLLRKNPYYATLVFAFCCLLKFQTAYFAPVFLLSLFSDYKLKDAFLSILVSAGMCIIIFLPFMLNSGFDLPFRVYLGGLGKYPFINLNSFNIYGLGKLNWKPDSMFILPGISFNVLSLINTFLVLIGTVSIWFFSKTRSTFLLCVFIMEGIFILTTRMHERYEVPVLIFLLVAFLLYGSYRLFVLYILTSGIVFINQLMLLTSQISSRAAWQDNYDVWLMIFSALNVVLFLYTVYVIADMLIKGKAEEKLPINNSEGL